MYTLYLGLEILLMCVLSYRDVGLVWFAAMACDMYNIQSYARP